MFSDQAVLSFWQFDSLHRLATDAEIQRQLGRCTLFELIQILIYLIHEIEYLMTDQAEGGAASRSNVIVEESDEESDDEQLWNSRWYIRTLGGSFIRCGVKWLAICPCSCKIKSGIFYRFTRSCPATASTSPAKEGELCIAGISAFECAEVSSTK